MVEALGASVPFSLEQILVKLEGGRYIGPILPVSLFDLVTGRWSVGGGAPKIGGGGSNGGSGGRNKIPLTKVHAMGGPAQVWARYDAHLPSMYFWDGDKLRSILSGEFLPNLHSHIICKEWHLCGVC